MSLLDVIVVVVLISLQICSFEANSVGNVWNFNRWKLFKTNPSNSINNHIHYPIQLNNTKPSHPVPISYSFMDYVRNIYENVYERGLEKIKYRKLSMSQYQYNINYNLQKVIEAFYEKQQERIKDNVNTYESMIGHIQDLYKDLYNDVIKQFEKQKFDLYELNNALKQYENMRRSFHFDESLDQFKRFYSNQQNNFIGNSSAIEKLLKSFDEQILHIDVYKSKQVDSIYELFDTNDVFSRMKEYLASKISPSSVINRNLNMILNPYINRDLSPYFTSKLKVKYDKILQRNLIKNWENILYIISESSKSVETNARPTIKEFIRLQDDITLQLSALTNSTRFGMSSRIKKTSVNKEKRMLENRLRRLEQELGKCLCDVSVVSNVITQISYVNLQCHHLLVDPLRVRGGSWS